MAKILILSVLVLFASLINCFVLWPTTGDLRYPTRSMAETIFNPSIPTSDLDDLRYPTEPLLTTWIAQAVGFFTQKMVSLKLKFFSKVSNANVFRLCFKVQV